MRPEGIKLLPWLVGVVDLLMIALATVLAIRFRVSLSIFDTAGDVLENSALASVFFVGTWLVMLVFFGTYELHVFGAGTEEFKLVVNASFFTAALVATMAFLMQYPLSRGFFVLLFPIGVLLLVLGRLLTRRIIQRLRIAGHFNEKVLLVGTPGYIGEIHTVLAREKWLGYQVMGCLVPSDYAGLEVTSTGIPVLGHSEEVRAVVDELNPDIVFFTAGAVSSSTALRRLAWDLEDHAHVQIIVAPNVTDVSSERVSIRPVAGLPLMHLGRSRSQLATNDAKRAFDLVGALLILAAAVAAAARADGLDQAARRRSRALPADPRRSRGRRVHLPQAALDVGRRRAAPGRDRGARPRALQEPRRPAGDQAGTLHPTVLARRAAPADRTSCAAR